MWGRLNAQRLAIIGILVSVMLAGTGPAAEYPVPIDPDNSVSGSGAGNYSGDITKMTDGSGMNGNSNDGPAGWPRGESHPSNWVHTTSSYPNEWQCIGRGNGLLSGATNGKIGWVTYDLGESLELADLYFWNLRSNPSASINGFNVYLADNATGIPAPSKVDYEFSVTNGWTQFDDDDGNPATPRYTLPLAVAPYNGTNISVSGMTARFIGIEVLTNYSSTDRIGLSEFAVTAIDTNAPTLAPVDIVDDASSSNEVYSPITYTLTFGEEIDPSTLTADDFTNAFGGAIVVDSMLQTAPAVFEIVVTPTVTGSLQLRVSSNVTDWAGLTLAADVTDVETITVIPDSTPPEVVSFVDSRGGVPMGAGQPLTYTVTFNEHIDATSVSGGDFVNASGAVITVSSVITGSGPTVFRVDVTPEEAGFLRLQLSADSIVGKSGNTNDTVWMDDDVIVVAASDAADGTWGVDADGNWTEVTNWESNIVARGTNSTAMFPDVISSDRTVTLDDDVTIGNITASDANRNYIISGAGALTLATSSGMPGVEVTQGGRLLKIDSVVHTTNGLATSGNGTLILNRDCTVTGGIDVADGFLRVGERNHSASINGGSYTGALSIASGSELFLYSTIDHTFSGPITGGGNLRTGGDGDMIIPTTNNTYTGKTLIQSGGPGNPVLHVASLNSVSNNPALGTVHVPSSSLGAPTNVANGTIALGSPSAQRTSVLRYTGAGETTDRVVEFWWNGSGTSRTLDASGSGLLKFVSTFVTAHLSGNRPNDVTLQGSGDGELVGGLDLAPVLFRRFTKAGSGTWTVGGAIASYDYFRVSSGTLNLNGDNAVTHSSYAQVAGGTLNANGNQTFGDLEVRVTGGSLTIAGTDCLHDENSLLISGSGVVHLNDGIREKVGALSLDGNPQDRGTYGSSTSRAMNKDDDNFSGKGVLYVDVDIPAPGVVLTIR